MRLPLIFTLLFKLSITLSKRFLLLFPPVQPLKLVLLLTGSMQAKTTGLTAVEQYQRSLFTIAVIRLNEVNNKYNKPDQYCATPGIIDSMNKSQERTTKIRNIFQQNYERVKDSDVSIYQAIGEVLEPRKSVRRVKVGLVALGKGDKDMEKIKWKQAKSRQQFISLCEQLAEYFEEQRDQSMRSTEKNLSEMNEQLARMKKSLSEKGILLQFRNQEQPKEDQADHDEVKSINRDQEHREGEEGQEVGKSIQHNVDANQGYQQQDALEHQQSHQSNHNQEQEQDQDKIQHESNSFQKTQPLSAQPINHRQQNVFVDSNKHEQVYKHDYGKEQQLLKSQNHTQRKDKKQQERGKKNQDDHKVVHQNQQQQQKLDKSGQPSLTHKGPPIQWEQISMSPTHSRPNQRNQEGKLDTLPQQLDNEFYDEDLHKSQLESVTQVIEPKKQQSKYNPHVEIMKKLSKRKKQTFPEPRNELQGLYYSLRNKLVILFAHYLKQLKTSSFTFDQYPQSLDLKTFSSYYKHFGLSEICKVSEIPKLFKKYSTNGAWLDQTGFLNLHTKILALQEDAIKQIDSIMEQRANILIKYEQDLQAIHKANTPDKDKLVKEKKLLAIKELEQKPFVQFQEKLKAINGLLSNQEIKKLTRKAQLNPNIQSPKKMESSYDRQRLKKIVETHSGIYKQDIIEKLKERKKQKEKRHQLQMHRIIEKYKANGTNGKSQAANSAQSFTHSNHSTSSLHKVQGYARRNKIRKHGTQGANRIEEVAALKGKDVYRSEPKLKPYMQAKQPEQQADVPHQDTGNSKLWDKKPQVYRELSLPKLPKRKMREQSIYESLKAIDTKTQIEMIKKMLGFDQNAKRRDEDEKIFSQFYSKEKLIMEKERTKKAGPVQNRMKFT